MSIPAIVLAAGASTRLGRPKQLVEYKGETLLARALRLARESGADPILAVLGAHQDEILAAAPLGRVFAVYNAEWQQGIASSIQAGLRTVYELFPSTEGVLLLNCDQPHLSAKHLRALLSAFSSESGAVIAASAYEGVLGTPGVFPRFAFRQLFDLRGDTGARALLGRPPCPVVGVPFPEGEIDIDTPADLDQLT